MAQLKSPRIEVRVFGETEFTIPNSLWMEVEIEKDLESEPNKAYITAHNLAESGLRGKLEKANDQSAPIEIHMTRADSDELVLAFKGEIDDVSGEDARPGHETYISCYSAKEQTRNAYINQKTYAAGTAKDVIIGDLVTAMTMPIGMIDELPTDGILIAETFNGPAFPLLQEYVFDLGMRAYVLDGKINITNVIKAPPIEAVGDIADVVDTPGSVINTQRSQVPLIKSINRNLLLGKPQKTKRNDDFYVEMKTVIAQTAYNPDPFVKKKKKKNKTVKAVGENDYVDYSAVDKTITGVEFKFRLQPDLNPDDVLTLPDYPPLQDRLYSVVSTNIDADNHGGPYEMLVVTDDFDDSGGDLDTDEDLF
jgi:hypothetical protein